MKLKFNLLKKALTVVGALAVSTTITTSSLAAVWGSGDGYLISAKGEGFAWGQQGSTPLNSWRVTLYVSTKSDGTIDPRTDAIGSSALAKIGTIVYNNIFAADPNADVFIQTTEHAESRLADWNDNFPYVSQVKANHKIIRGSDSARLGNTDPIYHSLDCPSELPSTGIYTNAPSGSDAFITTVLEHMNNFLGGTPSNFIPIYNKILDAGACAVGTSAGNKLDNAIATSGIEGYMLLLPTNPDCVVQWCCVVEPLVERRTNQAGTFFEAFAYDTSLSNYASSCIIQTPGESCQYLLLDAYATAQYNDSSRRLYSSSEVLYKESVDSHHIENMKGKTTILELTTQSHSSSTCLDSWGSKGQLLAEWGSLLSNSATVCYDTHSEYSYYCGVPVAGLAGPSLNYSTPATARSAATYGGIAVLISKLPDDEPTPIPVYYYIYDEFNNPTGEVIVSYYIPDENGFIPSTEYGIPIADEALSFTDDQLTDPSGNPKYYYCDENPSLASGVVDSKGSSADNEWRNPKAITDPLAVGTGS